MRITVFGASGATGKLVVERLLNEGRQVRGVVRRAESADAWKGNSLFKLTVLDISKASSTDFSKTLEGSDAAISCLGHRISFKGIWGNPRDLVTRVVEKIQYYAAHSEREKPLKLVLMSTTACINASLGEKRPGAEKPLMSAMRALLPPHRDNEDALQLLLDSSNPAGGLEWVAVRPDSLVNAQAPTPYTALPSTIRSPVFDAGVTSRINAAHFMVELVLNQTLWSQWRFLTPVVYNDESIPNSCRYGGIGLDRDPGG